MESRVECYVALGRLDEAMGDLRQILAIDPGQAAMDRFRRAKALLIIQAHGRRIALCVDEVLGAALAICTIAEFMGVEPDGLSPMSLISTSIRPCAVERAAFSSSAAARISRLNVSASRSN